MLRLPNLRHWKPTWVPRDRMRCNAFGGIVSDRHYAGGRSEVGGVRLCDKDRWHTDSHTYEIVPNNGRLV